MRAPLRHVVVVAALLAIGSDAVAGRGQSQAEQTPSSASFDAASIRPYPHHLYGAGKPTGIETCRREGPYSGVRDYASNETLAELIIPTPPTNPTRPTRPTRSLPAQICIQLRPLDAI